MSDSSSRHLDNVCIGLLTIATVVFVGTFGLIGIGAALTDQSITARISPPILHTIVAGILIAYVACLGYGCIAVFATDMTHSGKLRNAGRLVISFIILVGIVCGLIITTLLADQESGANGSDSAVPFTPTTPAPTAAPPCPHSLP